MAAYRMFEVIWGLPDTPGPGLLVNAEQLLFPAFPKTLTELSFFHVHTLKEDDDDCNDEPIPVQLIRSLPNLVKLSIPALDSIAPSLGGVFSLGGAHTLRRHTTLCYDWSLGNAAAAETSHTWSLSRGRSFNRGRMV